MPRSYTHPYKTLWRPATCLKQLYQCAAKLGHENFLTAMRHAVALKREKPESHFNIYECRWCGLMHVGHSKVSMELPAEVDIEDLVAVKGRGLTSIGELMKLKAGPKTSS